jgi:hypothetical protein
LYVKKERRVVSNAIHDVEQYEYVIHNRREREREREREQ